MLLNQTILIILVLAQFFWLTLVSIVIFKSYNTYKRLTSGISKKDFVTILKTLKTGQTDLEKYTKAQNESIHLINQRLQSHIQKLGFVRYNPFGDTGGDQSFCLCLLDELDNGILITSLHARQQTRTYTKLITAGTSSDKAPLSKEEVLCIKKAKSWGKKS